MSRSRSTPFLASLAALALSAPSVDAAPSSGRVFAMTNEASGNRVLVYGRAPGGMILPLGEESTGGLGTGSGLGSQGALTLHRSGKVLLAVNAGSDEISVLRVLPSGLLVTDVAPSGGDRPISVTAHGDLVYVVHSGSPNTVTGFRLSHAGVLDPIPGATRSLSDDEVGPAQIQFSPRGDRVVVTEKMTNRIDVFDVAEDGSLTGLTTHRSSGATPFGFGFRGNEEIVVSEAFGGMTDASAVSSYRLEGSGALQVISPSVPTTETAACWVAITGSGRFAYTTNTGSNSVTGYSVSPSTGELALLDADGVTGATGGAPTDMALSRGSRFLYVLNSAEGTITALEVLPGGALTTLQSGVAGLPTSGAAGIAAF